MDEKIIDFFRRKEIKQISRFINENSIAAVALISLGLFIYTFLNIQSIFNPPLDQQQLLKKKQVLAQKQIQFEDELIDRIKGLKEVNVDTDPKNLGTDNNPFD